MKIAFDVHGVIDTYPDIIFPMVSLLYDMGNKICIVSGPSYKFINYDLEKLNFFNKTKTSSYMNIYSVVDFLQASGVKTWKDENGNIWTDNESWWDSKAKICQKMKIDYMIDDSEKYRSAFDLTNCKFININELINKK